ncbi:MAG: dihydrolipoyl dehydrogenase [Acidobacteria bacterium]|nr:MAG: dihydrolipoyl dehydrogenase [Acidobacteriota bacterium]REK08570.1 MAG: dihydrolipoyl dehydrogenase [Acidobacteriota bacterium]
MSDSEANDSTYDLVVIGSGPGGYVAAIRAAQLGLSTALVEKDAQFGGTCLHRGCIPTKAWLHSAEVLESARDASRFGVQVGGDVSFDPAAGHAYRRDVVQKNARGVAYLLEKNGVTTVRGRGRLRSPTEVEVEPVDGGAEDGPRSLPTRHVLLATGSVPRQLDGLPTDGRSVLDSDQILQSTSVPERLLVLGGGAVGVEFASIFASLGSKVTLVEVMPRLLPLEDEEVSAELARALRRRGIDVRVDTRLEAVQRVGLGVEASVSSARGAETIAADQLLVAVGRSPVTRGLGIEQCGIQLEGGRVVVNGYQQTAQPNVYAIGDVIATPLLAHVASAEGILAVEHIAGMAVRAIDYDQVPWCTYCDPEVASVGLTEKAARERGLDVAVGKFPFSALGKAAVLGKTAGFVKVVREKRFDQVLGVHIIGPSATDLIAEACVALRIESTNEEIIRTIHAHPTLAEAVAEAAHAAAGHAIHI